MLDIIRLRDGRMLPPIDADSDESELIAGIVTTFLGRGPVWEANGSSRRGSLIVA